MTIFVNRKTSLICMVAYIIDLTLVMDALFYLTLSKGQGSMSIKLINKALLMYKEERKARVHFSIRAWADRWGAFSHMDAEAVINKIEQILFQNSIQPETWSMSNADMDEDWIQADRLRDL